MKTFLWPNRASVAIVKSRDLHWGLLATRDHKEILLSSLRMLLVADGANPWSLSSCDQFLSVFQSKGRNKFCVISALRLTGSSYFSNIQFFFIFCTVYYSETPTDVR